MSSEEYKNLQRLAANARIAQIAINSRISELEAAAWGAQVLYTCGPDQGLRLCVTDLETARRAVHKGKPLRPIRRWVGGEIVE